MHEIESFLENTITELTDYAECIVRKTDRLDHLL